MGEFGPYVRKLEHGPVTIEILHEGIGDLARFKMAMAAAIDNAGGRGVIDEE